MRCCFVSLLRLRTVFGVGVHDDRGVAVSCANTSWATSDVDAAVNGVLGGILKDGSDGGGMGVLGIACIGVSGGSVLLAFMAVRMVGRAGAMFGSGVARREYDSILLSTFFIFHFYLQTVFLIFIFFLHLNWDHSKGRGFCDETQTKSQLPWPCLRST